MTVRVAKAAFAATFLFVCAAKAEPPPPEAFGQLPKASLAKLSPDGKYLAVIKPIDGRDKIVFTDLTNPSAPPYVLGMQGALASDVIWKSNTRAIGIFHANLNYKWHKGVSAWSRAMCADVPKQTAVVLMYDAKYFHDNRDESTIQDIAADDPDHVYMAEWDIWDRLVFYDLFRVDLSTGSATLALHGGRDTFSFLGDNHGHVLGTVDQDSSLTNHVVLGGKDVFDYSVSGASDFALIGALGNGKFVAGRPTATGTSALYEWTPSGFGDALFQNSVYDWDEVIADERDRHPIGATFIDDMIHVKYFDPAMQQVQDTLERAYPGQSVLILSKDAASSTYVIRTDGPQRPPVLSLYTPATHQTKIIESAYPDLKTSDLGIVKPYPYKARDGLDIHAYLTLPPGKDPHNLPTVIFPHGGPEARDSMNFDWWAQFMASRGYAVLQPNFRGSAGYGWSFISAGDGESGKKVQYDVQDGVAKLIADGIADPKRICIVGASYGGFMALAGATFSPDLYACAVSYAGVSDWSRDLYTGTLFDSEADTVWARRLGANRTETGKLDAISPAEHADQVKAPVLLIHSNKDVTVRIEQSEIEADALKRAGKQVDLVTLDGDDHYLEYAKTRTQLLKETGDFLDKHIGH